MSLTNRSGWLLAGCLALALAGCGGSGGSDVTTGGGGAGGGSTTTGRTFLIKPTATATTDMIAAMVQAAPGDVIQFDCGYFELTSALQVTHTEDVKIKGCGKDQTVLSFKQSNSPEGILGVNVHGLWIEDLTVLDTGGNGIELRGVDHASIKHVRAIWSSNGGRESPTPITAQNAFANEARLLKVPCTDPPTLNPLALENQYPGADTTSPDYTVSAKSGRYGIYPVSSENILIDDAESIGASDAGIYVGQTNNAIIKNSRAAYNVFGFEIENVQGGEYQNNISECNTGGFLVYDLDGLRQYGDRSRMYGNIARNNNTYNFTSGGFVGNVPPGSGMITLSYDRIDIFENEFSNNNTGGIIHASYELFPEGAGRPVEKRIDWYTEGVHIFRNKFINNGNKLPLPSTIDLQNQDLARLLPALVGLKSLAACINPLNLATCATAAAGGSPGLHSTGFRGAHILWDGLLDARDANCPYPKDAQGVDVPKDARGKPLHTNEHPNYACHYNAYKFAAAPPQARIVPDWWSSCIDDDNEFSGDSLAFANFHGTKGLEAVIAAASASTDPAGLMSILASLPATDLFNFASSFDQAPHKCQTAYGKNLPLLPPVVIPPFVRSGDFDPAPSEAQINTLCGAAVPAGQVNTAAAAVNCPTLDQYHLFDNAQDPTSAPNGTGVPFALNTKLFSDYSVKYRVLYLPPGTKALYKDVATGGSSTTNATFVFPTGTILAKTFSFADETAGTEVPKETRLLIRRENSKHQVRWDGMAYIWGTENGKRVARLALGGGTAAVSWDHTDVDSGVRNIGSTPNYTIPHANQCLSCHSNEDKEPGAAPIGLKTRFLNRPYSPESNFDSEQAEHAISGLNQIQYLCQHGLLADCPQTLTVNTAGIANVERIPVFNKPGDSGFAANSPEDIEKRARAYLEVNCAHCHNVRGFAASTGMYVDSFRAVDNVFGICKRPTATGQEGNGGRTYDIHPGVDTDSIMVFRTGSEATTPAARMPPLARSVVHAEGHALLEQWIRDVVVVDSTKYPGSENCGN